MMQPLKVAVLFGGQSGEHEVSLESATSVINNMDSKRYVIYKIGITKKGEWRYFDGDVSKIITGEWEIESKPVVFPADPSYRGFFLIEDPQKIYPVDMVFPVLHGPNGEDGTVQGLFELANIPYVGCGVLSSSTAMDKGMAKAIFASFGLPQGGYLIVLKHRLGQEMEAVIKDIEGKFTYPVFVKPANMGSSVGITKANDRQKLIEGLWEAAKYDRKIVVEEYINGREIECAVLGNNEPQASVPGEILPSNEFYDYHAKYQDGGRSELLIPAPISDEKAKEIQRLAIKAYKALECSGLARVDFFIDKVNGRVYLNEVNTMPGFTRISMYPKLWEATGVSYPRLIDRLIELAQERFEEKHST